MVQQHPLQKLTVINATCQSIQQHLQSYKKKAYHASNNNTVYLDHDELLKAHKLLHSLYLTVANKSLNLNLHQETNKKGAHQALQSFMKLTKMETDILVVLSKGYSYNEASKIIGCKISTLQTHIKHIYKKLNVHSRSEAIYEAHQQCIIDL